MDVENFSYLSFFHNKIICKRKASLFGCLRLTTKSDKKYRQLTINKTSRNVIDLLIGTPLKLDVFITTRIFI